jgi:hypothetical protein
MSRETLPFDCPQAAGIIAGVTDIGLALTPDTARMTPLELGPPPEICVTVIDSTNFD